MILVDICVCCFTQSIIDELVEQRETLQDSLNSAHQKLSDVDQKIENLIKLQVNIVKSNCKLCVENH